MKYSEKLKDPRWQKKRLEILERDEWSCRVCFDKENTLHVHHKRYLVMKEPWDHPNELLQTLCESCHKEERELRPGVEYDLLEMLKPHFGYFELEDICNGLMNIQMVHVPNVISSALRYLLESEDMMNFMVRAYFKSLKDKRINGENKND